MTEQQTLSLSQLSPRLLLTLPLSRVTSDGPAQGWVAVTPTCTAAGPPVGPPSHLDQVTFAFQTFSPGCLANTTLAKLLSLTLEALHILAWVSLLKFPTIPH